MVLDSTDSERLFLCPAKHCPDLFIGLAMPSGWSLFLPRFPPWVLNPENNSCSTSRIKHLRRRTSSRARGVKPGELPWLCEAGPPGRGVSSGVHVGALIFEVPLPPPPPLLWDGHSRKFRESRSRGSSACQSQKSANKGTRTS